MQEVDGYATGWQQAETMAQDWLRANGFPNARLTQAGADAGVDIECESIAAQVKAKSGPVGRPDVQRLAGAAQHLQRRAVFFSTSGYTREATDWATGAGVALFSLDVFRRQATPVNRIAHELHRTDRSEPVASPARSPGFQIDPARTTQEERKRFKSFVRSTTGFGDAIGMSPAVRTAFDALSRRETVWVAVVAQRRLGKRVLCVTTERLLIAGDEETLSIPHGVVYGLKFGGRKMSFVAEGRRFSYTFPNVAARSLVQSYLQTTV